MKLKYSDWYPLCFRNPVCGIKGMRKSKSRQSPRGPTWLPRLVFTQQDVSYTRIHSHYKEKTLRLNVETDFHMGKNVNTYRSIVYKFALFQNRNWSWPELIHVIIHN